MRTAPDLSLGNNTLPLSILNSTIKLYCPTSLARIAGLMCLAIPVKVISIEGDEAVTDIGGVKREVSIALTPEVKVGDYVLLHTGYAIGVVDEFEAKETLKLLEEIVSHIEVHR